MLKFRTYLSDRNHLIRLGETARQLALKTNDPAKFILDFAEERYPHYYGPLLEAFYLEVYGPHEGPPGTEKPASTAPAKGDAARPASEIPHGGVLDWLKDLFSGGGAAKNFDKALASMTKVDSVVRTITIPKELQGEGGGVEGYDEFRDELHKVLETMKGLSEKSRMLQVADAIKRDPNYVQELQNALAEPMKDADLGKPESPEEDASDPESAAVTKYGPDFDKDIFNSFDGAKQAAAQAEYPAIKAETDPEKKKAATVAWMKKHDHPAFKAAPIGGAPTVDDKVITPYATDFDKDIFNSFDGANQAAAQAEYPAIKALTDPAKKKAAMIAWMQKHGHPLAKKGFKESRRRQGHVVTESVFTEAMILAGIPTRRKK